MQTVSWRSRKPPGFSSRLDTKWSSSIRKLLTEWTESDSSLGDKLDLFTFGEALSLFDAIYRKRTKPTDGLAQVFEELGKSSFSDLVNEWHRDFLHLRERTDDEQNPIRIEYDKDQRVSCLQ